MNIAGRIIRARRLMYLGVDAGLIVPIDHGLTLGPVAGLDTVEAIGRWIKDGEFSAVLLHRGMLEYLLRHDLLPSGVGIVVHLNGTSSLAEDADEKRMVTPVVSAVRLGADAVSIQANFNKANISQNIEMIGEVTTVAHSYGLPILVMLYNKMGVNERSLDGTNRLIRIAVELGVDLLKLEVPATREHIDCILGQFLGDTKILFAGGPLDESSEFRTRIEHVLQRGCNGLCVGRNVFQSPRPTEILADLACMIREYSPRRSSPRSSTT